MGEARERLVQIRRQVADLRKGQGYQLEKLVEEAIQKLGELATEESENTSTLQTRLFHTLRKEVLAVSLQKNVTATTPKYKIREQEETFKKAVDQVVFELWDFKE